MTVDGIEIKMGDLLCQLLLFLEKSFPLSRNSRFVLTAFLRKADRNAWSGKAGAQADIKRLSFSKEVKSDCATLAGTNQLQEWPLQARIHPGAPVGTLQGEGTERHWSWLKGGLHLLWLARHQDSVCRAIVGEGCICKTFWLTQETASLGVLSSVLFSFFKDS